MFYPKNVPNIERALRIILGIGMVAFVLFGQAAVSGFSPLLTAVVVVSAIFLVLTGFVGWCPACAMVGRKLKSQKMQNEKRS
jgi:hypothetical protein